MSEIKTIWRGSTPCIRTTVPDNIAESIDSMIFSLKTGSTIIQKAYPGNVTKVGNVYHVGFSQNDTEQLENGKCTFQVQYNYKNSNVSYSNVIMYIADTPNNIEIIGDGSTKGTMDFIDITITADNVVLATDGVTFTPIVTSPSDDKLTLSWKNDGGAENPESVTITAPKGADGYTPVRGTDYWTEADKTAILSDAFDKLCPKGSASGTAEVTLADCCGGTNVRNYVIHGAEGGVGDLNSATGKYEIPVSVRGKNLFSISRDLNYINSGYIGESGTDYFIGIRSSSVTDASPGSYNWSSGQVGFQNVAYGTATAATRFVKDLKPNTTYTFSCDVEVLEFAEGVTRINPRHTITVSGQSFDVYAGGVTEVNVKKHIKNTFTTGDEIGTVSFWLYLQSCKLKFSNPQIEEGSAETDFESYTEPVTYTIYLDEPLGAGETVTRETGGDITLQSVYTNIIKVGTTVAPGKIEVEYYKDINKVLENLNNAILAQGGNV